jgi:hypothetical protein
MKNSLRVAFSLFLATFLFMPAVLPTTAFAQDDDHKSLKQDLKDVGHSTKEATIKTGHKVRKGTKKVVNKSAAKTTETSDKVADKTKQ